MYQPNVYLRRNLPFVFLPQKSTTVVLALLVFSEDFMPNHMSLRECKIILQFYLTVLLPLDLWNIFPCPWVTYCEAGLGTYCWKVLVLQVPHPPSSFMSQRLSESFSSHAEQIANHHWFVAQTWLFRFLCPHGIFCPTYSLNYIAMKQAPWSNSSVLTKLYYWASPICMTKPLRDQAFSNHDLLKCLKCYNCIHIYTFLWKLVPYMHSPLSCPWP